MRTVGRIQPTTEEAARRYAIECIKLLLARRYTAENFRQSEGEGYGGPQECGYWFSHGTIRIPKPWDGISPPKQWKFKTDTLIKAIEAEKNRLPTHQQTTLAL